MGIPTGIILNKSSDTVWVVETSTDKAIAHLLSPGRRSPSFLDADGVRALEGKKISGHSSWWKVPGGNEATIAGPEGSLTITGRVYLPVPGFEQEIKTVDDREFEDVEFDISPNWGESLS